MATAYVITVLVFVGVIIWLEHTHSIERKDLYNRIMSQNLAEYRAETVERPAPKARNTVKRNLKKHHESRFNEAEAGE